MTQSHESPKRRRIGPGTERSTDRLDSFDDLEQRSLSELTDLLSFGSPRTRVWAAWELGLRRGAPAADLLETRLFDEPHPGVRRHLVRMIAGFGAFASVRRVEREDPDRRVRRTARDFLDRCEAERSDPDDETPNA